MAFQFVPNADGSFDEGMRQTNTETGVEYIFTDGAWRPLGPKMEDQFDTLDDRYIKLEGTTDLGDYYRLRGPNTAGTGNSTFQVIDEGEQKLYNIKTPDSSNTAWAANVQYVNDTVSDYLPLTGGTLSDKLTIDYSGNGKIELKGSTNCDIQRDGEWVVSFKPSQIDFAKEVHLNNKQIKNLAAPTVNSDAATKKYVDDNAGGGVPVGSIMMWINSLAPAGWLKLKGGSFDITQYPLLHAYLELSDGYVSGKLPDWRGHYPGQIGDHLNGDVGIKLPQRTAAPSGGYPHSSSSFNNGENKTANKAGSTDFAGIRKGQVSINTGWDSVTRPKTVAVHFIIKHD